MYAVASVSALLLVTACAIPQAPGLSVCNLPADPGPCKALMPHFFFDKEDGTCKRFNYGGCRGNQNRFASKADCEEACIASVSVAAGGVGPADIIPSPIQKQNEICFLPAETGLCMAYIPSFFFNSTSGQCQSFVYGGCGGNQNRFASEQACREACVSGAAPVAPRLSADSVCNLPKAVGPCKASMPAFYYNQNTGQCESFIYGGCRGNANNFESRQQCEQKCKRPGSKLNPLPAAAEGAILSTESGCNQPKEVGPCKARMPSFFYNTNTGECEWFIYGGCKGNRNRFQTKLLCEQKCKRSGSEPSLRRSTAGSPVLSSNSDCNLLKTVGRCKASIRSFFYNTRTGECERFFYGGCGGNANRFRTKILCEQKCKNTEGVASGRSQNQNAACLQPKKVGFCRARMPRWFFNQGAQSCQRFYYGGCGGNDNNFATKADCERVCTTTGGSGTPPAGRKQQQAVCSQPKVTGPCRAAFRRFYFNTETGLCERFIYGGCRGNDNNFPTRSDCMNKCSNS